MIHILFWFSQIIPLHNINYFIRVYLKNQKCWKIR